MSQFRFVHDYASAIAYLFDRINYERTSSIPYREAEFRLDRMREYVRRLGDPHRKVPVIHLAGTKGKGSTAAMISSVLCAAGYKTGLYTSPHLETLEERFQINGTPCSPERLVHLTDLAAVAAEEMKVENAGGLTSRGPTFFELTTAMGFLYFAEEACDYAVLETGLGGRLDSTNVCVPETCVITTISFDHMKQLGDTLAAIAGEKAGIIKPGIPVVSGVLGAEPAEVIERTAAERNSKLLKLERDFRIEPLGGNRYRYRQQEAEGRDFTLEIALGMAGRHQADNAACAIAAVRETLRNRGAIVNDRPLSDALLNHAIVKGIAEAYCPARIEVVRQRPLVILDAAHNPASVEALRSVLNTDYSSYEKRTLIFAVSKDKSLASILEILLPDFDRLVCTRFCNNPRARAPREIAEFATTWRDSHGAKLTVETAETPEAAYELAIADATADTLVCIAGSFFLAAELRARFRAAK